MCFFDKIFYIINNQEGNMKVCASCGASLPDGAAFCISCGSKEFRSAFMPDLNAPEEEKPKIEYDQYGRPIGQQYSQIDEQPTMFADLSANYDNEYNNDYAEQFQQPQYIEQYAEQFMNQQQYGQHQQPQYDQQYGQQYGQPQYEQPQYQQYEQQYQQPQYYEQPQYEQPQYEQPQYEQPQYEQQQYEQPQYEQPQYEQPQYEQPQYEQPQYEQPQYEQPQYQQPEPQPEPEPVPQPVKVRKDPPKPAQPSFDSKNFKFEKKSEEEKEEEAKAKAEAEKPKNIKEWIDKFRDTRDLSYNYDMNDFAAHKNHCIIASLGITFWVPYAFSRNCQSSRFYANQGLLTLIVEAIFGFIYSLLINLVGIAFVENTFDGYRLSIAGWIFGLLFTVICFAIPVFIVVTSIQNINAGKVKEIPFIGRLRLIK